MADLISAVAKLAVTRNITVVLTCQTTTRIIIEGSASLQPAISGTAWDASVNNRILFFQDWQTKIGGDSSQEVDPNEDLRYAAVTKIGGSALGGFGEIVPFAIDKVQESNGLVELH